MKTTRSSARCRDLALVLGLVVLLAACGSSTPGSQAPPQQTPAPAQAQPPTPPTSGTPEGAPPTAAAAAPAAPAAAPAPPAPGALVQEHETGAELTLVEARRTGGDSLTVKWRYRNTSSGELKLSKGGTAWIAPYQLTAEAFLIDPVNKKKYLVITDDQRFPLASKHGDWQGVTLTPGQTLSAWAKFPAPPANVQKLTVTIPGAPPFEDVPVIK